MKSLLRFFSARASLVIAPSRRTLLVLAGAVLAVLVLGGAAWVWYAADQSRARAAYADVMVRVAAAEGPQATAEARTAAARDLEAILARYPSAAAVPQMAYQLGNVRYGAGQYAAARAAYEVVLARGATGTLRTLAQVGRGYTWEAERDWAKAMDAYRAALATLDALVGRTVAVSLPTLTLGIVVGLLRLRHSGGGFDAVIALTLAAWVVYGGFLILRFGAGWRGRRAAYLVLAGFVLVALVRVGLPVSHFS